MITIILSILVMYVEVRTMRRYRNPWGSNNLQDFAKYPKKKNNKILRI